MLKKHWWRYWRPRGANLPPVPIKMPDGTIELRKAVDLPIQFDIQLQTWDCSSKETKNADFVVGQVHAARGADRYLLDQVRERLDLPSTLLAVSETERALAGRDVEAGRGQSERPGCRSIAQA
jgi:phage terminase large subunit-like protein